MLGISNATEKREETRREEHRQTRTIFCAKVNAFYHTMEDRFVLKDFNDHALESGQSHLLNSTVTYLRHVL
jgi:hypothetical protein